MIVMLVEVTTIDQLVDRLKKGKYRDCASILAASELAKNAFRHISHLIVYHTVKKQAAEDDDDIVAGPQKMSLRDSVCLEFHLHFHCN
jgi:E3 SUMO-protein ligase PIAS1